MNDPRAESRPPAPGTALRWPPPGLERMQGDLGRIAARAGLAAALLVAPMLFVVAREQGFATLGPLADAWWVALILTTVGLAFSIDTVVRTARMLRRVGRAVTQGYDLPTVWYVLADGSHDMGFLLQGARHFAVMDERERSAMVRIRVFSESGNVVAGLWISVALGVGLLAAARDALTPSGLWMVTLLPGIATYAFAGVARIAHDARIRRARRAYHRQPWAADLVETEIRQWQTRRGEVGSATLASSIGATHPRLGRSLAGSGWVVAALGVVVVLPVLTLLPSSVAGPVLSTLATPSFDRVRRQAARVEAYRSWTVDPDPALSAREAGELLHELAHVGVDEPPSGGERPPRRQVAQSWLPEVGDSPLELDPFRWGDSLIALVGQGTTGAQRAYLAQVATHPSTADFSRLATASALDAAAARWVTPFPPEITVATIPIPRLNGLREGAQVHIASAAYALTQGREADAERYIREVVSVGFLLGDHGPTLIDNLIGYTMAESAGAALEDLYRVTGRDDDLATLRRMVGVAERASAGIDTELPQGTETWVRTLPTLVLDTTVVRGLRWEYFIGVTTLTPCLNLHRMVFGPSDDYHEFLIEARSALVRYPSEEGLFELARSGWLSTLQSEDATWIGRVLSVAMNDGESTCGEVVRRIESAQDVF